MVTDALNWRPHTPALSLSVLVGVFSPGRVSATGLACLQEPVRAALHSEDNLPSQTGDLCVRDGIIYFNVADLVLSVN